MTFRYFRSPKLKFPGRVKAAQSLYHHLHNGFTGKGVHRVPIAGDTTRLPYATGLTPLEKRLAWAQHHLAANLGGSQQLRQTMGHCQFGARVVYGDCIFVTISPNEQHSALVLRLSRFRRNDPYVQHGDGILQRLACADFPALEAVECLHFMRFIWKTPAYCRWTDLSRLMHGEDALVRIPATFDIRWT